MSKFSGIYEVLVKITGPRGSRFERVDVRAWNIKTAREFALDDIKKARDEKVRIILVQPKRATELWNKQNGFSQITVERAKLLDKIAGTLTEQEAKILQSMLTARLSSGSLKPAA